MQSIWYSSLGSHNGGFSMFRKRIVVAIEEIQLLLKNYLDYYTPLGV